LAVDLSGFSTPVLPNARSLFSIRSQLDDALLFPMLHTLTMEVYLIGRRQHSRNVLSKPTFGIQTLVFVENREYGRKSDYHDL
jgi:hypothetical protein